MRGDTSIRGERRTNTTRVGDTTPHRLTRTSTPTGTSTPTRDDEGLSTGSPSSNVAARTSSVSTSSDNTDARPERSGRHPSGMDALRDSELSLGENQTSSQRDANKDTHTDLSDAYTRPPAKGLAHGWVRPTNWEENCSPAAPHTLTRKHLVGGAREPSQSDVLGAISQVLPSNTPPNGTTLRKKCAFFNTSIKFVVHNAQQICKFA